MSRRHCQIICIKRWNLKCEALRKAVGIFCFVFVQFSLSGENMMLICFITDLLLSYTSLAFSHWKMFITRKSVRRVFHGATVTSLCLFGIYKYSIFNYLLDFLSVPESVSAKHESVDKLRNILEASAPAQGGGLSYKSWRGRGRICLSFLLW